MTLLIMFAVCRSSSHIHAPRQTLEQQHQTRQWAMTLGRPLSLLQVARPCRRPRASSAAALGPRPPAAARCEARPCPRLSRRPEWDRRHRRLAGPVIITTRARAAARANEISVASRATSENASACTRSTTRSRTCARWFRTFVAAADCPRSRRWRSQRTTSRRWRTSSAKCAAKRPRTRTCRRPSTEWWPRHRTSPASTPRRTWFRRPGASARERAWPSRQVCLGRRRRRRVDRRHSSFNNHSCVELSRRLRPRASSSLSSSASVCCCCCRYCV